MSKEYTRAIITSRNILNQSVGSLVGIVQGILADSIINDQEIYFLNQWLENNNCMITNWPGNSIYTRIVEILADGIITEQERSSLLATLQDVIGDSSEIDESRHTTRYCVDLDTEVNIDCSIFCLTGEFVFGTKQACSDSILKRGGAVVNNISKKVNYLVIGGKGSQEWKNNSFGTKIQAAMNLKEAGIPILVVHEKQLIQAFYNSYKSNKA